MPFFSSTPRSAGRGSVPAFVALFAIGAVGVASTLLVLPEVPGVPRPLLLINPVILLAVGTLLGFVFAGRVGWRSAVADRLRGVETTFSAATAGRLAAIGIGAGFLIAVADSLLLPWWQGAVPLGSMTEGWSPAALLVGLLYGGITEEIIFRWGLLSLAVWGLWKIAGRGSPAPSQALVWIGIVSTALLFGLGHLPALQLAGAELDAPLVLRTVGLNMLASILFASAFVRHNLETAMLTHAGFHLGVAAAVLIL